jgi:O-antigen ligase
MSLSPPHLVRTVTSAQPAPARTSVIAQPASNPVATAGFVLFSAYVLSGFANDWSLWAFGAKAYVSTITLLLLPVAWLFSGNALRGLRSRTGFCWAAFLVWMLLATPFSIWKGGSASLLVNYVLRSYMDFFYACAFVKSVHRCRQWMSVQIVSATALLISCAAFGGMGDNPGETRFRIPHSLFYANSNDLSLALLLGISSFLFLLDQPKIARRLLGTAGILLAAFYVLQTGSRGSLIASCGLLSLIFLMSRRKWKVAAFALSTCGTLLVIAAAGAPFSGLHRLSLVSSDPASESVATTSDVSSVASQRQREELFRISLRYTLAHPLFGVGPDQFAAAVNRDATRAGEHVPWLGTHNTYTQISSECGIPALLFYLAVIVLCLRSNFRLYRRTRGEPGLRDLAGLSRYLLAGTFVFAVSAFFFHMAYSPHLPILSGFSVALSSAGWPLSSTKQRA